MPLPFSAATRFSAAFAHLVAGRRDRLLVARTDGTGQVAGNRYRDCNWPATLPDRPYAVYLARADRRYITLAFDLDAKPGWDPAADATRLAGLLRRAGVRCAVVASGPFGGRHILATFPDGLPAGQVRRLALALRRLVAPSLDVTPLCNPVSGAIRPPLSPHRHGGRAELLTSADQAVRILREGNSTDAFRRLCLLACVPAEDVPIVLAADTARGPRPLSARVLALQRFGDLAGEFSDRSSLAAAITLGYVQAGRSLAEFQAAVRDLANVGLDHLRRLSDGHGHYRQRSDKDLQAATERMWTGRLRYAAAHPPIATTPDGDQDLEASLAAILGAADADPGRWRGQGGLSDRAALIAVLYLAARCRRLVVSASARQLAELANVEKSTAHRAVTRLAKDGWLTVVRPSEGVHAAVYRLSMPATTSTDIAARPAGTLAPARSTHDRLSAAVSLQAHDATSRAGLGRAAGRVLIAVTEKPDVLPGLAARTGLCRRTVRRALAGLATAGLVSPGVRWHKADRASLEDAARALGATGNTVRRVEEHAIERATFRWYLADRAARAGWTVERGLWTPGRHALRGQRPRPVPSLPYPRRAGRACWRTADRMLRAGVCPDSDSVAATLVCAATPTPVPAPPPPLAPQRALFTARPNRRRTPPQA